MALVREKLKKAEKKSFVDKYQKFDLNERLTGILGEDFGKYRENYAKAQNYGLVSDFPITVYLELVNRCNLSCIMCDTERHKLPLNKLSLDMIEKILKECKANKLPSLVLGTYSELLLYDKIYDLLDLVKEVNVLDVFFRTNGVLLNDKIIDLIIKNKVTKVLISVDATTPETYKRIRGHDFLNLVEGNIEKLLARRTELPIVRLSFVVMDINKNERQDFFDKWKDKVECIDFQRLLIENGEKVTNKIENPYCASPFYMLSITANGNIYPCCDFVYGRGHLLGNIYEDSLKDIWNGDKIREIRQQIVSKDFIPICHKCLSSR